MTAIRLSRLAALPMAALLLALAGCFSSASDLGDMSAAQASRRENGLMTVGVSLLDLANPYYAEVARGVADEASKSQMRIVLKDPVSDAYQQAKDLEGFIEDGMDAILVASLSPQLTDPILKKAMDNGIVVVAWATKAANADAFMGADEWEMGYKLGMNAGEWLKRKQIANPRVAVLEYPRIPQIKNRVKGMMDGLRDSFGDIEIAARRSASNPKEGYLSTLDILKEDEGIHMILAINDGGAIGALQALEETSIDQERLYIGGCDATPEALVKIKADTAFRCTVDLYPYYTGSEMVEFLIRIFNNENIPPIFAIPTQVIDQSNG